MTVTLPLTRGSTTKVLPVIAAICETNSLMSAFFRLIFHVCSWASVVDAESTMAHASSARSSPHICFVVDDCIVGLLQ